MFYSLDLLSAHRGKFGIICTEITSCILGKVRVRFSLYLASQLTFGLCIIYREKTKIVLRNPKPRSKKRKRDEIVIPDPPEIPMADLFGGTADFGDMQIPDLFSFPTINPDVVSEFLDTQNSLYQARVEDITMLEDNLNMLPPETVANVPMVNRVLPEPYTVPLEELNQSLSGHRDPVRRIRRAVRSKLIVDDVLRLTVDQLRYNMNHGEETMVLSSSRLAEPTSRLRTRYLLSNNVPRLLAVPANLETALSAHLSEFFSTFISFFLHFSQLWCRFRRMGEESAHQDEPELDVAREADPNISRPHGSTMRIAEETMETSIEQPRACQAASSLLRSVSLLGSTSDVVMDLTVNQAANMTDSVSSALPAESSSHPLSRMPDDYIVSADTVSAAPNPIETMPLQVEKTTLQPLLDEKEENRIIIQG
ncbi:hypothetical protein FBUS_08941 [Fasciolopsis buskii]|uniref:Rad21/Rec8-like protein N-terminal domain-containing protein n=1 Tax=Fasciolopsis buskii TaxID=27845 RepID=A0A8E0VLA3_9TREM|nr:hypothetical protein FBUS_08941 [Fasciolopsis buski]